MPWKTRELSDGRAMPQIALGSWLAGNGPSVTAQIELALETGFTHIDTAQIYRNESEVGDALRGIDRESYFLTTKWSGMDAKSIHDSIHESLDKLGVKSVDLYLIHSPRLTQGDTPGAWAQMLSIKEDGFVKSIGVSNFKVADLEEIRLMGGEMPVVNQVLLHPYVYAETLELLKYHAEHKIVTEAYSTLIPITKTPGGPVDKPIQKIAARAGVTPGEVLFAWARSKGAVIVTSSHSKERLESYMRAGDLVLTRKDIESIDKAGAKGDGRIKCPFGVLVAKATVALVAGSAIGYAVTRLIESL